MTFEHANVRTSCKPWGSHDLRPWNRSGNPDAAIGELRFDRAETQAPDPALLLKLLFTKQKLSIQVHPDDAFAQTMGLANGKTEAWYVLSAEDGAQVAIGLDRPLTQSQLRDAITDGSITDLVKWQPAEPGDVFFVPAGTIHAIGAGLVIAEIQQRSDTTFRLFDHGRSRELHVEQAVAVADLEPARADKMPVHLTVERMKLVSCAFFVLERIDLPPDANWELQAQRETWGLVTDGDATIGSMHAGIGDAFFAETDQAVIKVGRNGLTILLAYADSAPQPGLLRDLDDRKSDHAIRDLTLADISSRKPASVPLRSMEGHP
ncbi:class I mannose-6-phosphate isomerase [Neorhizobium galegae]|uniref:class I mannose-6-phosphate isomerase n=1 Tax=Neorhizobium galegae TaxID=399 RepID=UPI0006219AA9|nr:class I mannose-6-phosphate isomerase [Neorhizobium galegae]CDZ50445.1 Phosphomannose isomerase type I [Neorhizobium galegae bv. orientalis]